MKKLPIIIGLSASLILSGVYFIFLILIGGLDHAIGFIGLLWYWLLIIVSGFGLQAGLYTLVRQRIKSRAATAEVSTSLGVSTGSMIACCLHLAVDLLPILGLSALSIVLTNYQTPIILIGVFSNIIGVVFMTSIIKKHRFISQTSPWSRLYKINFKYVIFTLFLIAITTVTLTALSAQSSDEEISRKLKEIVIKDNNVTFLVRPEIDENGSLSFYISMNTHAVALDFNMKEIALLNVSGNNGIPPITWAGDGGGGHHRSGYLIFPYSNDITSLKLSLTPGGKFEELVFDWDF